MKVTLIIAFYDQYQEWPYVLEGIRWQTVQPHQILLAIDHSSQQAPVFGDLPGRVVRSASEHDGVYSRGAALNAAFAKCQGDVIVTTDADCILSPRLIETYKGIYEGKLRAWTYTVHDTGKRQIITAIPGQEMYIGARHWIPKPEKLPGPDAKWLALDALSSHDRRGFRGKPDGGASVWGCNMAFTSKALELEPEFKPEGKHQDAKWYHAMEKYGWEARPSPDQCAVLHMGPNFEGAYY